MPITPPSELSSRVALCLPDGRLNPKAKGYVRGPGLLPLVDARIPGRRLRRKRWNVVFVSHPEVLLVAALSHADYAGLAFVWAFDRTDATFSEAEQLWPLGLFVHLGDSLDDPATLLRGRVTAQWRKEGDTLRIQTDSPSLRAHLVVTVPPTDEHFQLVVPWDEWTFNYTAKLTALPTEGDVYLGGRRIRLRPTTALSCIDFTRGVWPRNITWHWTTAAGFVEGRRVGLNLGAGWTDGTGVIENVVSVDGKLDPLWEPVQFSFQPDALRAPWQIRTSTSERLTLRFEPSYDRRQATRLGVVEMSLDQVIGTLHGRYVQPDGTVLTLADLPAVAESHRARW